MVCFRVHVCVLQLAIKKIPKAFEDLIDAKRIVREVKMLRHFHHENVRVPFVHFHCSLNFLSACFSLAPHTTA
jgi:hypothetical protein